MRKSEATKMPEDSPCHEVQGDVEREEFQLVPGLFQQKINQSSTDEMFKNIGSNGSPQNMELEEGELIEGIEASDVGTLLEQFLEYEEKQGSLDFSSSSDGLFSSVRDTTPDEDAIALKISSFAECHDLDFVLPLNTENGATDSLDIKNSEKLSSCVNGERQQCPDPVNIGPCQNGVEKHDESSKTHKKSHVDNHATDHNYACSGFPMRKAPIPLISAEINGRSTKNGVRPSPRKLSDLKDEKMSNGTEMLHSSKRQASCNKDSHNKKSRIPKRYRGPYCEDSSGENSSCDEEKCYNSRPSAQHEKRSDYRRKQRKRKGSYSSGEDSYDKTSKRRHCLYSSNSSDERGCSSDEDSENEQRSRYDPRRPESNVMPYRNSSGTDRNSGSHKSTRERKRRSRSKDRSEKDTTYRKDKTFHDIELERKMGFKFDQHIKGTGKEERRIVYIGKIANKTTEDDVWRRFRPFGPIEKVTVHFRDEGDNYAFVTFFEYSSAAEAIERGNEDPSLPMLDICFGGRRKFCGGSYVDFDSNTSYLEQREATRPTSSDEMDFDTLLRLSQKGLQSRKESCRGR